MGRRVYLCYPGTSHLTDTQAAEVCKCGHRRVFHWWGGSECGEAVKNGGPCRCPYFRDRPTTTKG